MTARDSVTAVAGPSIALTKYWDKQTPGINRPATPSLGLTLDTFESRATVSLSESSHEVWVNGERQPDERFAPFWQAADQRLGQGLYFKADCYNNFPTGAGLASSASGLAALAYYDAQAQTHQWIEQLDRITQDVIQGRVHEPEMAPWLGQQASRAHQVLRTMGLSTPTLDQVLALGCRAGASGGKLSGAGGGGAFYLVCSDPDVAIHVTQSLQEAFVDELILLQCYTWDGRGLIRK